MSRGAPWLSWIDEDEKRATTAHRQHYPLEGYRRLTFAMWDADVAAVSPATVYRALSQAGLKDRCNRKPLRKGTGFVPPLAPHEHWHIDIAYLNLSGTFYCICSVLDGASKWTGCATRRQAARRPWP